MSARQRVAKFYEWIQRRGESPYQQFQGDGAFKVITFAVLVTLALLLFCVGMCAEANQPAHETQPGVTDSK
jgi:hypothetical protein